MEQVREHTQSASRRWSGNPFPPVDVLKELSGQACASCGARYYYLVLCVSARRHGVTVAARCSRCHASRQCLSEDQLVQDIDQAARLPPTDYAGSAKH
jgi:hypothetical protein